jgi:hypothetical protein
MLELLYSSPEFRTIRFRKLLFSKRVWNCTCRFLYFLYQSCRI